MLDNGLHGFDVVVMTVVGGGRRGRIVGGLASAADATHAPSPGRERGCRRGMFVGVVVVVALIVVVGSGQGTASRGPSSAWSPPSGGSDVV